MLLTWLLCVGVNIIMSVFSISRIGAWKKRGYDARDIRWKLLIAISAIVGIGLGMISYLGSENAYVSATISIAGYLTVFASTTDIMLLKIPEEPTRLATFLGAILFLLSIPTLIPENYLTLGLWGSAVIIFGICSFVGYLGDADQKLFVMYFFLFAWWLPPTDLVVAIFGMCIIGLFTTSFAKMLNIGVEKSVYDKMVWNPESRKMEAVSTARTETLESRSEIRKSKGKVKKFFPFGPAILLSFIGVAIFSSYNSIVIPGLDFTI